MSIVSRRGLILSGAAALALAAALPANALSLERALPPNWSAVINGGFAINQRNYVSGTALAPGAKCFDQWKAGANGCTLTFNANGLVEVPVTIAPGGSLVQVIPTVNVPVSNWWLSWGGNSQGSAAQGAASAAAGKSNTLQTGQTKMIDGVVRNYILVSGLNPLVATGLEFGPGTVFDIAFEPALALFGGPTGYRHRSYEEEMALCQWFYRLIPLGGRFTASAANQAFEQTVEWQMYGIPIITEVSQVGPKANIASATLYGNAGNQANGGFYSIMSAAAGDTYIRNDIWALDSGT